MQAKLGSEDLRTHAYSVTVISGIWYWLLIYVVIIIPLTFVQWDSFGCGCMACSNTFQSKAFEKHEAAHHGTPKPSRCLKCKNRGRKFYIYLYMFYTSIYTEGLKEQTPIQGYYERKLHLYKVTNQYNKLLSLTRDQHADNADMVLLISWRQRLNCSAVNSAVILISFLNIKRNIWSTKRITKNYFTN